MHIIYRSKKVLVRHLPLCVVQFALRWRWVLFQGSRYFCPFCEMSFRRMVPGGCLEPVCERHQITGMGFQSQMTCPRCGSINRWRLLWLYLQRKELLAHPMHVLHISPEQEIQRRLRAMPHIHYLSVDLENPLAMRNMDITSMDLPGETFDAVLCSHVLEHIPEDRTAMKEIFRVLKAGGWAILQVPVSRTLRDTFEDFTITRAEDRLKAYGQADHVRIYGCDYVERLRQAGFRVKHEAALELFGTETVTRYALDPHEEVFFCSKPDGLS